MAMANSSGKLKESNTAQSFLPPSRDFGWFLSLRPNPYLCVAARKFLVFGFSAFLHPLKNVSLGSPSLLVSQSSHVSK